MGLKLAANSQQSLSYRAFSCDVTNFAGNLDRHVGVPWDNSISIMAASPLIDYANNLDPHVKKCYC